MFQASAGGGRGGGEKKTNKQKKPKKQTNKKTQKKKKKKEKTTKVTRNLDQEQENCLLKEGMKQLICLLKNFTSIQNALAFTTIHTGQPKLLDFNYTKEIILPSL